MSAWTDNGLALKARDDTLTAITAAADALDDLPEQAAEAMKRRRRLSVAHGLL